MTRREVADRQCFPPRVRRQIEQLAGTPPADADRELTHWSTRSLTEAAVQHEIVPAIHHTTIGRMLRAARLQPQRWCYWKHTVWTDPAIQRALSILWIYERVEWLWQNGIVVLAVDEKPNLQVLERAHSTLPMLPGHPARHAFDYIRHGTVNMLASLTLHTGHMGLACLDRNDGAHFRPAIQRLIQPYAWASQIWVILDNGPSHASAETMRFFAHWANDSLRLRVLLTPPGASWLNLAESLLQAFSTRYISRGDWSSRCVMIDHLFAAQHEYNTLFAHPFAWRWTRQNFRAWLAGTPGLIRCSSSATDH